MSDIPASWLPDPTGKHDHRYWDGAQWTENVADAGVASTDPYEPVADDVVSGDAPTAVTRVPGDDTASYPTAASPPYPAPPPYVPPSPVATGGPSGRHRRGLLIGGGILALVALAVLVFLALDDDEPTEPIADRSTPSTEEQSTSTTEADPDDPAEDEDEPTDGFSDEAMDDFLEDAYGLSDEQAECLVERITEAMEEGDVGEEDALGRIFEYLSDCDISLEDIAGGEE